MTDAAGPQRDVDAELAILQRQLLRERAARMEAERLLEDKSRELWEANSALTEAAARLQELSERDPLTGLSNRRALDHWLGQRRTRRPRTGSMIGVLLIDVDHFKDVNDTHGHDVGDRLLQALARRIVGTVRADDLVVRQGGDEILVLLAGVHDLATAEHVARKVHRTAVEALELVDLVLTPSVSIGVSVTSSVDDLESATQAADQALYRAKANGRGTVVAAPPV